ANEKASQTLDIAFMIDITGSMQPHIDMVKDKVKEITTKVKEEFTEASFRVSIIGYRDFCDVKRFEDTPFDTVNTSVDFLSKLKASGGGDAPEDVNGGLQKAVNLDWKSAARLLVHIAD